MVEIPEGVYTQAKEAKAKANKHPFDTAAFRGVIWFDLNYAQSFLQCHGHYRHTYTSAVRVSLSESFIVSLFAFQLSFHLFVLFIITNFQSQSCTLSTRCSVPTATVSTKRFHTTTSQRPAFCAMVSNRTSC
jgi:hypothetical protein